MAIEPDLEGRYVHSQYPHNNMERSFHFIHTKRGEEFFLLTFCLRGESHWVFKGRGQLVH